MEQNVIVTLLYSIRLIFLYMIYINMISGIYYYLTTPDRYTHPFHISYNYQLDSINGITSWNIFLSDGGTHPSPNGGPHKAGTTLVATGEYVVYPYVAPPPPQPPRPLAWGSMFTNNAQVYYKSHSLSTGSGGSGVRNVRHKQRKT